MHMCYKFFTPLGYCVLLAKKHRLGPKLEGAGLGDIPKKIWDPLQPLKLATSNLVHNLGLGQAYQKTTIWTKIDGNLGQGSIRKNWDPPRIFATVEASNFKFGMQLGFGTSLPKKTTFRTKIGGGLGQGSIQKNLGPPIYFCNRLKKLVHNRFTLQNTSFRTKLGRVILVAVVQQVVDLCLFPVRFQ